MNDVVVVLANTGDDAGAIEKYKKALNPQACVPACLLTWATVTVPGSTGVDGKPSRHTLGSRVQQSTLVADTASSIFSASDRLEPVPVFCSYPGVQPDGHARPCFVMFSLFGVLVFIPGSAWGQNFSNVVVFGDSLDSGNVGRFTTNPDPVWSEIVAQTFGASGMNSRAGGPNYAFAGACVNPATPCDTDELPPPMRPPRVTQQIDEYLSSRGDRADPNALYTIWGGVNDVADSLLNDPTKAQVHMLAASAVNVAQVRRLQEAGARHILLTTCPTSVRLPMLSTSARPSKEH